MNGWRLCPLILPALHDARLLGLMPRCLHLIVGTPLGDAWPIDALEREHERRRLAQAIFLASHLERNAGPRSHVGITGRVDYLMRQHRLTPRLVLHHHANGAPVLHQRIAEERIVQDVYTRLSHHPVEQQLQPFDVEVNARAIGGCPSLAHKPLAELIRDSAYHALTIAPCVVLREMIVPTRRRHPAKAIELLHDQDLRAHPGCRKRCRNAGHSPTHDENVDFVNDGDLL